MTEDELLANDSDLLERLRDLLATRHITEFKTENELYECSTDDLWVKRLPTGRVTVRLVCDPKRGAL